MTLSRANILAEIYRTIDESSGSSYFQDASLIAYSNREIESAGTNLPIRLAGFRLRGAGSTLDYRLPEPVYKVIGCVENNSFTPPRQFLDVIGAGGLRTLLTRDLFSSYGIAFRAPDRVRIENALTSGETRVLWAYGTPGTLNATTISGTTVTATNDSLTVTIGGTATGISSAVHLNSVQITSSSGVVYDYVLNSASGTSVVLTEPFAGSTASTYTLTIGASTYLPEDWLDYLVFAAVMRLNEKEGDYEAATYYRNLFAIEKRKKRGQLDRLAMMGAERFGTF